MSQHIDLIAYEQGELNHAEVLELFSHLVASGLAWQLQGHYGRSAAKLITTGWLDGSGKILRRCDAAGNEIEQDNEGDSIGL